MNTLNHQAFVEYNSNLMRVHRAACECGWKSDWFDGGPENDHIPAAAAWYGHREDVAREAKEMLLAAA